MIRESVFAGQFYPKDKNLLIKQIESFLKGKNLKCEHKAKGLVLPHAGYLYSGEVAAITIASFKLADIIVILGTNHTGWGKRASLSTADIWSTPLGKVKVNQELSSKILEKTTYIEGDNQAHRLEHSIEVQLPLLQYIKKDFEIVPIVVSPFDINSYIKIGKELAEVIKSSTHEVTIIASSDLTHYEPQEIAKKKDQVAIESIIELNTKKLLDNLKKMHISMCGYAPTSVMIETVKNFSIQRAELVKYQTSGDTTGDYSQVVGYAGIAIY